MEKNMLDLGELPYDEGYRSCPCFWGNEPSSLVRTLCQQFDVHSWVALDVGCGEGKNAYYLSDKGAQVYAIDASIHAIDNAKRLREETSVVFQHAGVEQIATNPDSYNLIVSYGLFHCLPDKEAVAAAIHKLKLMTKLNGIHVVCTFNDGPHDLSAHPGFSPLLLPHAWYLAQYSDWQITHQSSMLLHERHPNNDIPHFHSMTRILATRHT